MVASGIGVIVFVLAAVIIFFSARSFAAITNYVDLDRLSRNALDVMSTEIRQVDRLVSYKDMVSVHMDALRNTELNKTLISALQESSKTLKGMGIVEGVRQAEAVVSDVEASMAQAQELTAVLNAPLTSNTVTDAELDAELGLLLEEEAEDLSLIESLPEPRRPTRDEGGGAALALP